MKRDERSTSRFGSGCRHGEDYHEFSDGAVTANKKNREAVSIVGLTPGRYCMICPDNAKAYGLPLLIKRLLFPKPDCFVRCLHRIDRL